MKVKAYRNIRDELARILGHCIPYGNNVYSTQHIGEEFVLNANVDGQVYELKINFQIAIDLDELTEATRPHMTSILEYFNVIVKQALRQ